MSALRRTRSRGWARLALMLPLGLIGCGTPTPPGPPPSIHAVGSNDPAWMTNRANLPPPETDKINYDARTRTLTLYDLPGNDRWLVQLPGEEFGHPVTPQHRLPDVDPAKVLVYYVRPGYHPSESVTVKQILDSGGVHVSMAHR